MTNANNSSTPEDITPASEATEDKGTLNNSSLASLGLSGNEAIAKAEERAKATSGLNIPVLEGLSIPQDTANLREGPNLHDGLLGLLPLVGVWRGEGEADTTEHGQYHFGQQIIVSHNGENYLSWTSETWILDEEGKPRERDQRESGFWRIDDKDNIEVVLSHSDGYIEIYNGKPINDRAWQLDTELVARTLTGPERGAARRLYGLVEGTDLGWVEERQGSSGELIPRMSARLHRYIG